MYYLILQIADFEAHESPSKLEGVPEPQSARGEGKARVERSSACGDEVIATQPNIGRGRVSHHIRNTLLRRFAPPPLT